MENLKEKYCKNKKCEYYNNCWLDNSDKIKNKIKENTGKHICEHLKELKIELGIKGVISCGVDFKF